METIPVLECGKYYHLYNKGVNKCNLFSDESNFIKFLHLYQRYVRPVADTYSWVLMPNHIHFLIRVKNNICYQLTEIDRLKDPKRFKELKWETVEQLASMSTTSIKKERKLPQPSKHFSHFFNAYAKYFNYRNERNGALFERTFKRKPIDTMGQIINIVKYIHCNPLHHGFCEHPYEYPWSSYHTILSNGKTSLQREAVIKWFGGVQNFKEAHNNKVEILKLEKLSEILE